MTRGHLGVTDLYVCALSWCGVVCLENRWELTRHISFPFIQWILVSEIWALKIMYWDFTTCHVGTEAR
jgi:hypothetical protein